MTLVLPPDDDEITQEQREHKFLSGNLIAEPMYGARYPTDSYPLIRQNMYKTAQLVPFGDSQKEVAKLRDPYSNVQKARFEDAVRSDPIIRRALVVYSKLLLGRRTKTIIDTTDEFMDDEKRKQVLHETFNESEVDELKTFIDTVNRRVKLRSKCMAAAIQCRIGGRSALFVEPGKKEEGPSDLKILNWRKMGQVYADPDTWQLLAVDYADRAKDDPYMAENLIYFTNLDFNISADSLYYGLSDVETVAHVSEVNRLIDEEDLKEANRALWASRGLIKFPPNTSRSLMREFMKGFKVGAWNATSQMVDIQTYDLKANVPELVEERDNNDRRIERAFGIPSFVMGFEQIANRATAETVLEVWRALELADQRSWLQDILEEQWFNSLIKIKFPDVDLEELPVKAKLEYEDLNFETLKDKAEAALPLYQAGAIPLEKLLELLGMKDVLDKQAAMQADMQAQREQQLLLMQTQANGLMNPGQRMGMPVPDLQKKKEEDAKPKEPLDDEEKKDSEDAPADKEEEPDDSKLTEEEKKKKKKKKAAAKTAELDYQYGNVPSNMPGPYQMELIQLQMQLMKQESEKRMEIANKQMESLKNIDARIAALSSSD